MHYPWWYVPHLTSPMLIAAIAVIHVIVSHYAVGGGIYLAMETSHAYRTKDKEYLGYLKKHTQFFVLLTVAFGAITGVGIWWTIGLASPISTEVLIRTFVFGWAMEYVFFVLEIVSAFIFFYYWGRLPEKTHQIIGWIYAAAAWISLVLITGITAFMLTPGAWLEHRDNFWIAFLNPQLVPQVIARTGGAILITALYVFLHASVTSASDELREQVQMRLRIPTLVGALLVAVGSLAWFLFLPESAKATIVGAAPMNILIALLIAVTVSVFAMLFFGPHRNSGWLSPGFAASMLMLGVSAIALGEFVREAVRKPYIIYNVVLGNQIEPKEVAQLQETGYLNGGTWTRAYIAEKYPQAINQDKKIDGKKLLALPPEDRVAVGRVLFQYHCNDCHAAEHGYSAAAPLLQGRSRSFILDGILHLETTRINMPPWCGTPQEAELLADYLATIAPLRPSDMLPQVKSNVELK